MKLIKMLYSVIFAWLLVFHAAISAQEEDEADIAMVSWFESNNSSLPINFLNISGLQIQIFFDGSELGGVLMMILIGLI